MAWQLFFWGGWIPLALVFLWAAKELWLHYISGKWFSEQKFVLLAIDVPRNNDVPMKAVENMFTYFAGAHGTNNLIDTYWIGKFQLGFSFEIVSIDGYTQFLIRTPVPFRNLVESAVYSVYPDAEISEVNDYTENVPEKFPDSEWDLWGSEFIPVKNHMYPIKTYKDFEDMGSPTETRFKDPLASLMDLNSSLRPGEQLWYQILVTPTDFDWVKEADVEKAKIIGKKLPSNKDFLDNLIDIFRALGRESWNIISAFWGAEPVLEQVEEATPKSMMELEPKEKKQLEAIERKASQLGYLCKIRMIYVAKKDVINKPKAINGFVGYIKQFIDLDLNNFKPDMENTATSVAYFFKDKRLAERQNNILNGYKGRSGSRGRMMKILSIEELSTLWHFPHESVVKAPLIQKSPGRRSEPPMTLPISEEDSRVAPGALGTGMSSIFEDEVLRDENISGQTEERRKPEIEEESRKEVQRRPRNQGLPEFFDDDEDEDESSREVKKSEDVPSNLPFV